MSDRNEREAPRALQGRRHNASQLRWDCPGEAACGFFRHARQTLLGLFNDLGYRFEGMGQGKKNHAVPSFQIALDHIGVQSRPYFVERRHQQYDPDKDIDRGGIHNMFERCNHTIPSRKVVLHR